MSSPGLKDLQTGWHGLAVKLDNAIGVGVPKAADGGEATGNEAATYETLPPPTMRDALRAACARRRRRRACRPAPTRRRTASRRTWSCSSTCSRCRRTTSSREDQLGAVADYEKF